MALVLVLLVIADIFLGDEATQVVKEMWKGGALLFILSASPFFFLLGFHRDASRLTARTGSWCLSSVSPGTFSPRSLKENQCQSSRPSLGSMRRASYRTSRMRATRSP